MTTIISEAERKYLLENMKTLLSTYDHYYTVEALELIIDKWATEKRELIEAFKRHPNYLEGKFMIVFDVDYERGLNEKAIEHFSKWLLNYPIACLRNDVPADIVKRREREGCYFLPDRLYGFLCHLNCHYATQISDRLADKLAEIIPEVRIDKGMKFSRAINKICTYLGYDKHENYNREYAKFADAVTPMTVKRHTILSINPLDYLTMSFGNSWASCHTIDKENKREMPNSYEGQYCSGTISYMLDNVSMVLYTVDDKYNGDEYWTQPKITRQMFHWGEDKLIQGRLYPQGNDGLSSAYDPYRQIVQEIMSVIFNFSNLWTIKKGYEHTHKATITRGTHYPDYAHFNDCTISHIKGKYNHKKFIIGSEPICIECGGVHIQERQLNCCLDRYAQCHCCGRHLDAEEAMEIAGRYYCTNCAPDALSEDIA